MLLKQLHAGLSACLASSSMIAKSLRIDTWVVLQWG